MRQASTLALLAVSAALGLAVWWAAGAEEPAASTAATAAVAAQPAPPVRLNDAGAGASASAPASLAPFSAEGLQARGVQRALWQQRLAAAEAARDAYLASTRYPPQSQPIAAHPDQVHPNLPIEETMPLAAKDDPRRKAEDDGATLHTSQERVFVQGAESVRFTIAARDRDGKALPLRVLRAGAREVPPPNTGSLFAEVPMAFVDDGSAGDLVAADGVHSAMLQPQTQGFAELAGQIRVEAVLQVRDRSGRTHFDIFYTPEPPAVWSGAVRESVDNGSLHFDLPADVRKPGRYVVSARVDDAAGKPIALLGFNDELGSGPQAIRLTVFGKLLRDLKPAFPLALRDVDGFLLHPDSFPDRSLMPRRIGVVHVSGRYALASFSDAEWQSEARERYLAEFGRDIERAKEQLERLPVTR